ncbi:Triacylglycerol lipase [Zostera marina]|uniref:Lipase n=1 Tax=Zostera marina TaxID=29655 RepID=A0A0K9NIZ4_ZOSMR|nr:Triacylglycerol lipase [Zostera marina]
MNKRNSGSRYCREDKTVPFLLLFILLPHLVFSKKDWLPDSPLLFTHQQKQQQTSMCEELIRPMGYPCVEHKVKTEDGYILAIQRIQHGKAGFKTGKYPPVFLQHGLFMGGDSWFLNPTDESLGYILADQGFDVWVGNVRGTQWSYGHISLLEDQSEFWDWSWEDLSLYDLKSMIKYVSTFTKSKVFFVGHSQGTIMGLASFTMPETVEMVQAAALLCPISYLNHISSSLILTAVNLHLDQILLTLGYSKLNFRSDTDVALVDFLCDHGIDCINLLSSITGENCCFNSSRIDYYLQYEPQPSSAKNLNHLFQMIRTGNFAKYDYGFWGNLKTYGSLNPPDFNLADIPASFPIWMAYGGNDALADIIDINRTINELKTTPQLLYRGSYGHIDFLLSVTAKHDVYEQLVGFFHSQGQHSSSI